MAQISIGVTVDPGAASKDPSQHAHRLVPSGGDVTWSYDPAKVTNLATLDTVMQLLRLRAISSGLK